MTYAIKVFQPGVRIREWFEAVKKAATEHRMQRDAYVRILDDLQSMSDFDLADLGISRLTVKDIAHEAAYGDRR